jgi:hypothetical protein
MTALSLIKTAGRSTLVALVLGGVAMTALPAFAAPPATIQLQLNKPAGAALHSTHGHNGFRSLVPDDDAEDAGLNFCLTNKDVKDKLRSVGFHNVKVKGSNDSDRVKATGIFTDGDLYSMRVDKCSGKVNHIQNLDEDDGDNGGNGFGNNGDDGDDE